MIKEAERDAAAQALGETRADIDGLMKRYGEGVNARDFDGQPYVIQRWML